jgi:hypothetical protein
LKFFEDSKIGNIVHQKERKGQKYETIRINSLVHSCSHMVADFATRPSLFALNVHPLQTVGCFNPFSYYRHDPLAISTE